ncbi:MULTISPECIES: exonuclease domain-containing protein [Clostridium]|uniref:DNA polymerase III n=1 Tax=Clostridium cadaveris TaxID=1529 RepID=A0A316MBX0_9CLOT|nr:exonuclease domain-containing protein [Clostridium cadaveris]MDU4952941.1 exonuclease domain-containing protein [Clostridium sp.]PWL55451.1 MAG: DNA polymerase III [Clostridium cadaveris]
MHYFTIDFETANSHRGSVCAIGIVEVLDSKIINTFRSLINPEESFDFYNTLINGISEKMVLDKPTFPEIWDKLKNKLQNQILIAHNAAFDFSVLRHVLEKYNIDFPDINYTCTRILSKKTWPNLKNYKLDTVAKNLNISFEHHDPLEDAVACYKIFEEILSKNNIYDISKLHNDLKVKVGQLYRNGYKPCEVKSIGLSVKSSFKLPDNSSLNTNHELYNKGIAFTGTLESMVRKDAAQAAIDRGAFYCNTVTTNTNYLVMGIQDYKKFADGKKSSKLKKAEDLIEKGQDLEIIDEIEFIKLL